MLFSGRVFQKTLPAFSPGPSQTIFIFLAEIWMSNSLHNSNVVKTIQQQNFSLINSKKLHFYLLKVGESYRVFNEKHYKMWYVTSKDIWVWTWISVDPSSSRNIFNISKNFPHNFQRSTAYMRQLNLPPLIWNVS